jgi:hypothetical protein
VFDEIILKKQNCVLQKFLPISSKNEILLKTMLDAKRITLLNIKTYHYDIFMTKFMGIMKASKNVQNITFYDVIYRFSPSLTQHES